MSYLRFRKAHYLPAFLLKIQGFIYKIFGKASAVNRIERISRKCRSYIWAACEEATEEIYNALDMAFHAEYLKKAAENSDEEELNRLRYNILAQEAERRSHLIVKQTADSIRLFSEEMMCKARLAANAFAEGFNFRAKPESKMSLEKVDFGESEIPKILNIILDFSYPPTDIGKEK